jgi:hypothetical protein
VRPSRSSLLVLNALLAVAACSSGTEPNPPPVVDCSEVAPTALPVGGHAVIDAALSGCVRIPSVGAESAEYLSVALATDGRLRDSGLSVPYKLLGSTSGPPPVASARSPLFRAFQSPSTARSFHQRLRVMERELSQSRAATLFQGSVTAPAQAPPVIGEKRTFNVLRSADSSGTSPGDFVQVTGTAMYIGSHVAIFLDDAAPSPGYAQSDIDRTGAIFDEHLYPIDVTAFGSESDVNNDDLVLVLLTDKVTKLANCREGSFVIGYFFAVDLIPSAVGSNGAEIFYGLAPDPGCNISPDIATSLLPQVFIHEFQHMISYNQHALIRGGGAEDVWLNEGLSTFAEELGGRQIPNSQCSNNDCFSEFVVSNLRNGYNYLRDVESNYLVGPEERDPPIPLTEYGATWLFVRWVVDHFAQTPVLGTDLTQRLVATNQRGSSNVSSVTGVPFPTLVSEWQMANYLDDLPGFTPGSPRLAYESWNFRQVFESLNMQRPDLFPLSYPLVPDSTTGSYSRSGVLRAGSGQHVLLLQSASSPETDLKLTGSDGIRAIPDTAQPRIGLVRIR